MKKLIGIWLDTKKAVLISLTDGSKNVKTIESEIESRERLSGEKRRFGRFGLQYLNPEKHKKYRLKKQINLYMKNIINELNKFEQIVLFGPSEMKNNLKKELMKNHTLSDKIAGVESAEAMTENQMVAWVRDYYTRLGSISQ